MVEFVVAILPMLVVIAGLYDVSTMKIPNWLNLLILALFYPAALILGLDWMVILHSSLVGLGVLIAGMVMFALRWLGGGDAKLIAAVALWMGPQGILGFLLLSALVGGLFCLVLMSARFWLQAYRPRMPTWAQRLLEPKGDVPYGVAIAAGALWAYPASDMVQKFSLA